VVACHLIYTGVFGWDGGIWGMPGELQKEPGIKIQK